MDRRVGRLQDATIGQELWYPHKDDFQRLHSNPDLWVAYDPRRQHELAQQKEPIESITAGKLITADFDELQEQPPDVLTPTGYADLQRLKTHLNFVSLDPPEMIEKGYIKPPTET